ncbi:MAG: PLP-dependent aminotransferase family protein [Planctomycetota bacterium]
MQVSDEIERLIAQKAFAAGTKLPSSRDLAGDLRVNRNTIVAAYQRLLKRGVLTSGVGQGTFVAEAQVAPPPARARRFAWSEALRAQVRRVQAQLGDHAPPATDSIDFSRAIPDPDLYPVRALQDVLARLSASSLRQAFDYAPAAGFEPLREALVERARRREPAAPPRQVIIVNGSQQGLQLAFSLLLDAGNRVGVDAPTFPGALDLIRLAGATPVAYRNATAAFDDAELDEQLASGSLQLLYAIPTFHNPTGFTWDRPARHKFARAVARHQVPVIEDDWLGELRTAQEPPPLWTFDETGHVVTVATFSKVVVPGLRVGWMLVPPESFEAFAQIKRRFDLCTNLLGQMMLFELMRSGELDPHLDRVRRAYQRRRDALRAAISRHFPSALPASVPDGGITAWVELDPSQSAFEVMARARSRGVILSPGHWFAADGAQAAGFRICYATVKEPEIERGIEILGTILKDTLRTEQRPVRVTEPLV